MVGTKNVVPAAGQQCNEFATRQTKPTTAQRVKPEGNCLPTARSRVSCARIGQKPPKNSDKFLTIYKTRELRSRFETESLELSGLLHVAHHLLRNDRLFATKIHI